MIAFFTTVALFTVSPFFSLLLPFFLVLFLLEDLTAFHRLVHPTALIFSKNFITAVFIPVEGMVTCPINHA